MHGQPKHREPLLWWIAGADSRILAECPRGDQLVIQHLGISLIAASLFIFLITTVSILVAFPDLLSSAMGMAAATGFAMLIAGMVFLIDRLFIQADWDWQATKQRRELARAAWEQDFLPDNLSLTREFGRSGRAKRFIARTVVITFRILLSAAVALTIASFLELVIYKHELRTVIERLHFDDNRSIYDEIGVRTLRLDSEIRAARTERDRQQSARNEIESELNRLELTPPPLPSDRATAELDAQIAAIRTAIAAEETKARQYSESMVGELRGTVVHPGDSGVGGAGPRYATLQGLKALSDESLSRNRREIANLEAEKARILANRGQEHEAARRQIEDRKAALRAHLHTTDSAFATVQARLTSLEDGRDAAIAEFTGTLKSRPDFVQLSFGIASQFRALRALYSQYGSRFEMIMLKLLIMLLEMTPVLQKVFLSPTTLYAVKLDAARRATAYLHFDEDVRLRQQHLRRKWEADYDEVADSQGIALARQRHVRPLVEGTGAG